MVTIEELVSAVYFEYSHALPRDGQNVYETRIHACEAITDIMHELNNHKYDETRRA